ncbi:hypothetical protein ACFYNM_06760 [Streptomyces spororaveus]|uniref:hypothetical protein n=1 Tax=Streptomyces spororaveus TaxID=284039 RepID=UPI0036BF95D2
MGGFAEEVFCARLYAARLAASTGRPDAEVMDRYLSAHESRPERAEALGDLARLCRVEGQRWPLAYLFARAAARIPFPSDVLFVEFDWYDWRALDELAVAAYWIGAYEESAECAERLLAGGQAATGGAGPRRTQSRVRPREARCGGPRGRLTPDPRSPIRDPPGRGQRGY